MNPLYGSSDRQREAGVVEHGELEPHRSPWRRDYARLIHSSAFRRLQGKTQVFPGHESDFFRNRLTHSLEVAQIAKSIAIRLNSTHPLFKAKAQKIDPDLVEFAGMAHDLGHPPFGHNGEEALDECMREHGGFEGNAQTLHILSKLEKKSTLNELENFQPFDNDGQDRRAGLNLTYRSLASILKYDDAIPMTSDHRGPGKTKKVVKGYYDEEKDLVKRIKSAVVGDESYKDFKTIECSIMDIADDIAYSTYDLEDIFKSGFLRPLDLFELDKEIYENVVQTINERLQKQYKDTPTTVTTENIYQVLAFVFEEVFFVSEEGRRLVRRRDVSKEEKKMAFAIEAHAWSQLIADNGYYRTDFTAWLIQLFLEGVEVVRDPSHAQLHKARLTIDTFIAVETLKNIAYQAIIRSPRLQVVEFRGKDIIKKIFDALVKDDGDRLLPSDFRKMHQKVATDSEKRRVVCDFIAGMTDRYAIEFYSRLFGANGLTMHKPF
ncbi:dNTP triphosphohydrolase [Agrobacterium rubi]|uniref:dGTP triphosphohydrolase n=1 Tax=Agrobacterium rubi TaxID=28099 RepID=UPI0015716C6A|nr:dNTP triphosphohydrolase [Agrobacterium rubi]NTF07208.1 dNTP triphosphohydrolase [Agrobacterium rubi]NTF19464.1 dNTP triphosphohydrolase [Agrobacterium rubi]NTF26427.1 dNTP triphosphohydrolase [Agrobacterium rubi]